MLAMRLYWPELVVSSHSDPGTLGRAGQRVRRGGHARGFGLPELTASASNDGL